MKLLSLLWRCSHVRDLCGHPFGIFALNRIPTPYEFLSIPHYDRMENEDLGTPQYFGRDELGIDIYVIGFKNACDIMIPTIKSYLNANNIPSKDVLFVEAL